MQIVYRNRAPGRGLGSIVAGVLLFVIGLMWLFMVAGMFNLYWHRAHYIEGELEVTAYHYQEQVDRNRYGRSRPSSHQNQIEGIFHPGGQKVYTNDRDVSVMVFETESSAVGTQPTRQEVEGKRYKVIHWPDHEQQWWQPAATMSGSIPELRHLLLHSLILLFLLVSGVLLIRRGKRRALMANRQPAGPGQWPHWTGGVFMLTIVLWLFFALLTNVVLTSEKLNRDGTERLARTTKEWIVAGVFTTIFGIVVLLMTWLCLKAVRHRFSK
ncbi:MAG: hypothetical protein JNJ77_10580 [Planctomycetia bacterium]|nr:hypothetical protein [Planctomycetia bacterium]